MSRSNSLGLAALVFVIAAGAGADARAQDAAFDAPRLTPIGLDVQARDRRAAPPAARVELSEVVRRVSAGRPGRMLPGGISFTGSTYVVRWEYPGGEVVRITVDAATGRIIGEG